MATTAERTAEAVRAEVAFQVALAQIGATTIQEALRLWGGVPATGGASVRRSWLRRALSLVLGRRRRARALSIAYYRYTRALRTGYTIRDPRQPNDTSESVDLGDLRDEFNALVRGAASEAPEPAAPTEDAPEGEAPASEAPAPAEPAPEPEGDSSDDEADRILQEEIDGITAEAERQEREAQRELEILLEELGTANLDRKVEEIDNEQTATEVDGLRDEAHRAAGTRQAAMAERIAMNGGRGFLWDTAQRDPRVFAYARVSRTGTPCGWCAMLISRGAVYKTAQQATTYGDGDLYHDNCHCYAEPLYSREQFDGSEKFDLNRQYAEEWPRVTRGLSGKSAISAWRRYIRQKQRAQAARETTTNVQEA